MSKKSIRVFDFFSGCGGTSCGLRQAGLDVVFAIDNDRDATETFKINFPNAEVLCRDIKELTCEEVLTKTSAHNNAPLLFCGCAPCQPFSKQRTLKRKHDERIDLLDEFSRFVCCIKPDFVMVENVPGLQRFDPQKGPLARFLKMLYKEGYNVAYENMPASAFGVPQRRMRFVLVAGKNGKISLPVPTHGDDSEKLLPLSTVRDWIEDLPQLNAGETDPNDPEHQSARLSELNLQRIRSTPEGGGRSAWAEELKLKCHHGKKGHSDTYGRLSWDRPASGLTTRCLSYSNGRFGHPEQDRGISLREAACLQTFPRSFRFSGSLESKARQVGNAVPPLMAKHIGEHLLKIVKKKPV